VQTAQCHRGAPSHNGRLPRIAEKPKQLFPNSRVRMRLGFRNRVEPDRDTPRAKLFQQAARLGRTPAAHQRHDRSQNEPRPPSKHPRPHRQVPCKPAGAATGLAPNNGWRRQSTVRIIHLYLARAGAERQTQCAPCGPSPRFLWLWRERSPNLSGPEFRGPGVSRLRAGPAFKTGCRRLRARAFLDLIGCSL
jgi:hypothetical protein